MILLDRDRLIEFSLEGDAEVDAGERPTFLTRALSARQSVEVQGLLDECAAAIAGGERVEKLLDVLRIGLVDWRNVPGELDVAKLDELLTLSELSELVYGMIAATTPTAADRKNSDSQSASAAEPSANTAPDSDDAGTDRPQQPRSS